jgi:hypothetical protein
MGFDGTISGLDMMSSAVRVVGRLGRCTIEKPSSSLEESVTKPMSMMEDLGRCTSVDWPDVKDLGRIVASLAILVSLWYPWSSCASALGIW